VNHWRESAEILARLAELSAAGGRAALATVVRIVGSAYRRPGAKLLIPERGETAGGVSGGCLEADVREVARAVLAEGRPRLLHYDTGAGDTVWGLGLGCSGQVDVFVQPATTGPVASLAQAWRDRLAGGEPFAVATVVAGEHTGDMLLATADGEVAGDLEPPAFARAVAEGARERLAAPRRGGEAAEPIDGRLVCFEILRPPPHLLVCGAGDDSVPLVAFAAQAGLRVTVVDHREGLLGPSRFPAAAGLVRGRPEEPDAPLPPADSGLAVVKTHSLEHDREWVRRLLAAGWSYVGVLGPRARTAEILRSIGAAGDARVFAPVGLDLGADGPQQVALSIVAELLAVVSGRTPRHLSERREAIHAE
jgi:xanthine/CO dehydrogenase XdhC/CoxF family maturation factor